MGSASLYPSSRLRPLQKSKTVAQARDPIVLSAMVAAVEDAGLFEPMPDDARAALLAGGCKGMNRALEAIESVRFAVHHDLKALSYEFPQVSQPAISRLLKLHAACGLDAAFFADRYVRPPGVSRRPFHRACRPCGTRRGFPSSPPGPGFFAAMGFGVHGSPGPPLGFLGGTPRCS